MKILIVTILALVTLTQAKLSVSSTAFKNGESIPIKYTCEGENINPPISLKDFPKDAKSLTLIVDDPDAPKGTFDHWVVWNIIPSQVLIKEDSKPGTVGKNGTGKSEYLGPCPPSGTHRYFFKVYALDVILDLKSGADKKTVENGMKGHIIATGEMIGLYKKTK